MMVIQSRYDYQAVVVLFVCATDWTFSADWCGFSLEEVENKRERVMMQLSCLQLLILTNQAQKLTLSVALVHYSAGLDVRMLGLEEGVVGDLHQ